MEKKICFCVSPTSSQYSYLDQFNECINNLREVLNRYKLDFDSLIKLTIFIKADNNFDFEKRKYLSLKILEECFQESSPSIGFIGQPPADGKSLAFETFVLDNNSSKKQIERKKFKHIFYTVVHYNEYKEVYATGVSCNNKKGGTLKNATDAFELMQGILNQECLTFSDVIRQWNYIENILCITKKENVTKQNYQIFNDVRSQFYRTADFINGYPAATGIGMNAGGIIIDFIAAASSDSISVIPVKNPNQIDAYEYSKDVLVGDSSIDNCEKTAPKFERAKYIANNFTNQIFISGTAAILGQNTIPKNDIERQTKITINNIYQLVRKENLVSCGIRATKNADGFSYIRIYVKNKKETQKVKKLCDQYFPNVSALFLEADVCRDNLLVEIEGISCL